MNLTDELVRRLKPAPRGRRYEVVDNIVAGLLVRVSTSALGKITKSFLVRARIPGNADFSKRKATTDPTRVNPTRRSLGLAGRVTVEQARAAARRHFELISQGRDPAFNWTARAATPARGRPPSLNCATPRVVSQRSRSVTVARQAAT